MPIQNNDIARKFNKLADILEIQGKNRFRVRAYREAAGTIRDHSRSIEEMVKAGEDLTELSGIGEDLAGKIQRTVEKGKPKLLEEKEKNFPEGLARLLNIEDLGPKSVKKLYDKLGIESIDDLKKAVKSKKIRGLSGFGKKSEKKIKESLEKAEKAPDRFKFNIAEQYVSSLKKFLDGIDDIKKYDIAGSFRRRKDTVGDIDILAAVKRGSDVNKKFNEYNDINKVVSSGKKKTTVILKSGLQVDFRIIPAVSYGAALLYFTGSKAHTVKLRKMANENDWSLNEYGLYEDDDRIAGKTEKSVYKKFGLKYIEPELRENRGEFEAAEKDDLPHLIEQNDIKGDLHVHTDATDGKDSLKDMVQAAEDMGYEYFAITEHTMHVSVAGGLNENEFEELFKQIDDVQKKHDKIKILKGAEVDIIKDGSLDLKDEILKEMDIVIASVHYKFDMPAEKQTDRILKAMDNKYVQIIGHPTGRMLNKREPYDLNIEKIIKSAKDKDVHLELNAYPNRLDLNDVHCKMAKEAGVKIAINTDSHKTEHLKFMKYGIGQARRGWLTKDDVINTRELKDLRKLLKR